MPTVKPPALPISVEQRGATWVLVEANGATLPEGEFDSEAEAHAVASRINSSWANLDADARKALKEGATRTLDEAARAEGWHCADCKDWGWR